MSDELEPVELSDSELAEIARGEAAKRERIQTSMFLFAGVFILVTPWLLHFGKIVCLIYHVKPPDDTLIMGACLTGITTILARAAVKKK